jgi:hypothetical protein
VDVLVLGPQKNVLREREIDAKALRAPGFTHEFGCGC